MESPLQEQATSHSIVANVQLTLLYQLEQRKVHKLETENRALRERINNLLSKEDDERIEKLAADKTLRKLIQLRAITERTIKSLESGISEFKSFVDDLDGAVEEGELNGALQPVKPNPDAENEVDSVLRTYNPQLRRIPESPLKPTASSSSKANISPAKYTTRLGSILDKIKGLETEDDELAVEGEKDNKMDESDTVDETPQLEQMELSIEKTREDLHLEARSKRDVRAVEQVTLRSRTSARPKCSSDLINGPSTPDLCRSPKSSIPTPLSSSTLSTPQSTNSAVAGSASGRQKRNAATKVGSYKLPPLNKKMRREK